MAALEGSDRGVDGRWNRLRLAAPIALLLLPSWAGAREGEAARPATVRFQDVTQRAGIHFQHRRANFDPRVKNVMPWITAGGAAVAVGDFNNDGLDDLYFTTSVENGKNALYRNEGGFRFTEIGARAGVADVNSDPSKGTSSFALWFDYDNDGWPDLLLLRFGKTALFHNNRDETFTDVSRSSGIERWMNTMHAVAFDYDRDGRLDLYIPGYFPPKDMHHLPDTRIMFDSWEEARNGGPNVLFHNNGDGTFSDVTEAAGVQDTGWSMAVGHGDIDNDGWQDLYVANDFGSDSLFRNRGDGTFDNVSARAIGPDTKKSMNVDFGDYNGDGFLDIYVTNMTEPYLHECNMLWKNKGDGTFTDVSQEEGACDTGWGWGAKFVDVDNDGLLDLYAANGFISAGKHDYMEELLEFFFREGVDLADAAVWPAMGNHSMAGYEKKVLLHRTAAGYRPISKEAGVDDSRDGRGVAIADFDGDGRMDLVVSNVGAAPVLFRNVSENSNHWVELRLEGRGGKSNPSAIGTRVEAVCRGIRQIREVNGGNGYAAESTLVQHFGLGPARKIDRLTLRWPDGEVQELRDVDADRLYRLKQGGKLSPVGRK